MLAPWPHDALANHERGTPTQTPPIHNRFKHTFERGFHHQLQPRVYSATEFISDNHYIGELLVPPAALDFDHCILQLNVPADGYELVWPAASKIVEPNTQRRIDELGDCWIEGPTEIVAGALAHYDVRMKRPVNLTVTAHALQMGKIMQRSINIKDGKGGFTFIPEGMKTGDGTRISVGTKWVPR